MKKQFVTIGVICVCLILFGGAFLLLSTGEKKEEVKEEVLLELKGEELLSLKVVNETGGYAASWKNGKLEVLGLQELATDEVKLRKLAEQTSVFVSLKQIENGKERLSDFGLDKPAAEVEVKTAEKKTVIFLIGDAVLDEEKASRYVAFEDNVYVMEEEKLTSFFYGQSDFLSDEVSPSYESISEASESALITEVEMKRQGEDPLLIRLSDSEEMAGYVVNSYQIESPVNYPANANIVEDFLTTFFDIHAVSAKIVGKEREDLSKFGLDKPYVEANVVYETDKEHTFLLRASKQDSDGNVYILRDEEPIVYCCKAESTPWMMADWKTLLGKEIFSSDIRKLFGIIVKADEKEYDIKWKQIEEEKEEVICNGENADAESLRNLYYMLISQNADEILLEEIPDTDGLEKMMEVTYLYADGKKKEDTIIYYKESPRKILAILNDGERGYRLSSSGPETFLDNLEKFAAGEKIEARY